MGDKRLLCRWKLSTPGFWWRLWRIPGFPSWSAAPPCAGSVWTSRWLVEDLLSSSAPGTASCRTREMPRWWLSLWLPWTAGHPRPAGDPGGCSWHGNWCTDGWAEVDVENICPPLDSVGGRTGPQQTSPLCGKVCQVSPPPTWPPSTLASWGSCSSCLGLPTLSWEGSVTSSPAGTCTKGLILGNSPLNSRSPRRTQAVEHRSFGMLLLHGWCSLLRAGLCWLIGFLDERHRRSRHMVSLPDGLDPLLQDIGPRTWDSSKGAVLTVLRTCGWKPKFLSKASRRNSWMLEAAVKPAETAATCASWMMANFSRSSLDRWSLGDSSSIT